MAAAGVGLGMIALAVVLLTLPTGESPSVTPTTAPAQPMTTPPAAPVAPPPAPTVPPPIPPPPTQQAAATAPSPTTPARAEIVATSLPRGAALQLDGKTVSRRKLAVSPGRHILEVALDGFVRRVDTLQLGAGQSVTWAPKLVALPAPRATAKAAPPTSQSPPVKQVNPDDAACKRAMAAGAWQEAFPACDRAAAAGVVGAQRTVAVLFQRGDGVRRNDDSASRWFGAAARGGDVESMYQLAMAYERGRGIPKDQGAALDWYARAANGGHAEAQYALGEAYEKGRLGAPKDKAKALEWYRKAAAQGLKDAVNKVRNLGP